MRKIIPLILALLLICGMGAALADINLAAIDPETGRTGAMSYAEGDYFSLRVGYDLPPYIDAMYCKTVVEICGVTVEQPDITVKSGEYVILGQIECFPAYVTVSIEDIETGDVIDSATYNFRQINPDEIAIPHTGGETVMLPIIIILLCATVIAWALQRRED